MLDENVIDTLRKLDRLTKEQNYVIRTLGRQYLPSDSGETLLSMKEKIRDRIVVLRSCLTGQEYRIEGDPLDVQMKNELDFLVELMELGERI